MFPDSRIYSTLKKIILLLNLSISSILKSLYSTLYPLNFFTKLTPFCISCIISPFVKTTQPNTLIFITYDTICNDLYQTVNRLHEAIILHIDIISTQEVKEL